MYWGERGFLKEVVWFRLVEIKGKGFNLIILIFLMKKVLQIQFNFFCFGVYKCKDYRRQLCESYIESFFKKLNLEVI